jgi:hypothetical protein
MLYVVYRKVTKRKAIAAGRLYDGLRLGSMMGAESKQEVRVIRHRCFFMW